MINIFILILLIINVVILLVGVSSLVYTLSNILEVLTDEHFNRLAKDYGDPPKKSATTKRAKKKVLDGIERMSKMQKEEEETLKKAEEILNKRGIKEK